MPLPRFDRLDPSRRKRIIAAATAEFAACGFSGASYNRIIGEAGVSKGAMYYYFADKADLCGTVIEGVLVELYAACGPLGEFEDASGFWSELALLSERAMGFLLTTPEALQLGRLIYGEGSSTEVLRQLVAQAEAWCVSVLRQGQEVGAVRLDLPLDFLATAVTGMLVHVDRWFAERVETLDPAVVARLSEACLKMVQQVVRPEEN